MRSTNLLFLLSGMILIGGHQAAQKRDIKEPLIIRVTSQDPDAEAVVETSYIFDDEQRTIHFEEKVTPFEIKNQAGVCYAIFRQKSEKGSLAVAVLSVIDGKEMPSTSGGGKAIVVGWRSSKFFKPTAAGRAMPSQNFISTF